MATHPAPLKRARLGTDVFQTPRGLPHVGLPPQSVPTHPAIVKLSHALYSIALNHPDHSPLAQKFSNTHPSLQSAFREQSIARLQTFSQGTLGGALRAWRRYVGFLARLPPPEPSPFPVDPGNLTVFLSWVGQGHEATKASDSKRRLKGGAEGAKTVRSGLNFLRSHLELPFPTLDIDVRAAGSDAPTNRRGPAPPAQPAELEAMGRMAKCPNLVAAFVGLAAIVIVRGGIRFEHSRRSRLLELNSRGGHGFNARKAKLGRVVAPRPLSSSLCRKLFLTLAPFPLEPWADIASSWGNCFRKNRTLFSQGSCPRAPLWPQRLGFLISPCPCMCLTLHCGTPPPWQHPRLR